MSYQAISVGQSAESSIPYWTWECPKPPDISGFRVDGWILGQCGVGFVTTMILTNNAISRPAFTCFKMIKPFGHPGRNKEWVVIQLHEKFNLTTEFRSPSQHTLCLKSYYGVNIIISHHQAALCKMNQNIAQIITILSCCTQLWLFVSRNSSQHVFIRMIAIWPGCACHTKATILGPTCKFWAIKFNIGTICITIVHRFSLR